MMEYTSKYWNMLTPLIKKSLLKRYGKEETAELLRKTNQIYRDMLRRADDIGKDNPMASNLYEGLIFLALWDASDRQSSVDELRTISEEMTPRAGSICPVGMRWKPWKQKRSNNLHLGKGRLKNRPLFFIFGENWGHTGEKRWKQAKTSVVKRFLF